MGEYKVILNFNTKEEKVIYFDRLTKKKIELLKDNYIIMNYHKFIGCYIVIDYKLEENDKKLFNSNPKSYCY